MFRDHRLAQTDGRLAGPLLLAYGDSGRKYAKVILRLRRPEVHDEMNHSRLRPTSGNER